MLIIFDLDDTLIKTTESIAHYKLLKSFENFEIDDPKFQDFQMLKRLSLGSFGSKEALIEYLEVFKYPYSIQKKILNFFHNDKSLPDSIELLPGAIELIEKLLLEHDLVVVTRGKKEIQIEKIEKVGLSKQYFKEIIVVESGTKFSSYKNIKDNYKVAESEILVVGDRVEWDLVPAKKLYFHTVHMKSGRGVWEDKTKDEMIDYQICSLNQLSDIIEEIKLKNVLRKL